MRLGDANWTSERSSEGGVGGRGNPVFLWPPGTAGASERGGCPAVQRQGRAREVPHQCPPSLSLHDLGKMHHGPGSGAGQGCGVGSQREAGETGTCAGV